MPNLIDAFMQPCTLLEKKRESDGMGGFTITWTDGAAFDAAIVKEQSIAVQVAEKQGVTDVYKVTTGANAQLAFHDVFRRDADGATFRVTTDSADTKPPKVSSFAFYQVSAERWELV